MGANRSMPSIALYQPDIPQNAGTILRLCACLGVEVHVIEPAGFDLSDRALRRAGMDYLAHVHLIRHLVVGRFRGLAAERGPAPRAADDPGALPYTELAYADDDIILVGRESAGVPEAVHAAADARALFPMAPWFALLNVATAAAMVLGEALRQTGDSRRRDRRPGDAIDFTPTKNSGRVSWPRWCAFSTTIR